MFFLHFRESHPMLHMHIYRAVGRITRFHISVLVIEHIPLGFKPMLYSECRLCFNRLQALSALSNVFPLDSKIVPAYLIDILSSKETFPSFKEILS